MPELPEVETVRNILKKNVVGKIISSIIIRYDKILKNVNAKTFNTLLENEEIVDIGRKGKYLIFLFKRNIMISHLRMEGKYLLKSADTYGKHDHIIFCFSDGTQLRYNDTRKFGTMHVFQTTKLEDLRSLYPLKNVGPEPFEESFTKEYLLNKTINFNRSIKSILLDQTIVSGIGNIYVDEILFLSKIHPATNIKNISPELLDMIITNSCFVLNKAIQYGGTTVHSFKASDEISGRFQNYLLIHTKKVCPECGNSVKKERIAGRGTYFCNICQRQY